MKGMYVVLFALSFIVLAQSVMSATVGISYAEDEITVNVSESFDYNLTVSVSEETDIHYEFEFLNQSETKKYTEVSGVKNIEQEIKVPKEEGEYEAVFTVRSITDGEEGTSEIVTSSSFTLTIHAVEEKTDMEWIYAGIFLIALFLIYLTFRWIEDKNSFGGFYKEDLGNEKDSKDRN